MVGSQCNLKTHFRNLGYPLPLQIGGPKTIFLDDFPTANLTVYVFGMKHDIDDRLSGWQLWGVCYIVPKCHEFIVPQTASNSTCILPTLRKFCIPLHCQASQTEISKRNSTKLCQTVALTTCRRKVGVVPAEKWGPKNFYICSVFRRLRDLMANICWRKREIDNRARALKSTKVLVRCPKISWTLVHKRLKTGPSLFCFVSVHRTPSIRHQRASSQRL